jgi:hypothetical protein
LSISFPFGNVAVIPGLRLRASRPMPGVDSANNVTGTKDIGVFLALGAPHTIFPPTWSVCLKKWEKKNNKFQYPYQFQKKLK